MMALDQQAISGEEFAENSVRAESESKKSNGAATTQLPVIDIVAGKLSERTAAAIGALRTAGLDIFDRGGQLVRPVRVADPETLDGVWRPAGALVLRPIEPEWVRLRLAEVATWRKWDS